MFFTISCPHCEKPLEVDAADVGATAVCPGCDGDIVVPEASVGLGSTLGNFFINDVLGEGGMGCVYLATQLSMDRRVALKVLSEKMTQDKAAVERFIHEVRMAARLDHPNVVTAFEAGEDSGYYYLAMSYVQGKNLAEILREETCFSEVQALFYMGQIAEALRYAWDEYRVLHRDIKPANIMVDRRGNAKLMDLGISKSLSDVNTALTLEGTLLGTPRYMSPEQCEGKAEMDFRTDIYSLGATLFHLVVGRQPFLGKTTVQLVTQHLRAPVPSVHELNSGLSTGLARLIRKMMAKKAEDRHDSWDALIAALEQMRERALAAAQHAEDKESGALDSAQQLTIRSFGQADTEKGVEEEKHVDHTVITPTDTVAEAADSSVVGTAVKEEDADEPGTTNAPPPKIDLRRNRNRWLIRRALKIGTFVFVLVAVLLGVGRYFFSNRRRIVRTPPARGPVPQFVEHEPAAPPKVPLVEPEENKEVVVEENLVDEERVRLMGDLHAAVANKLMAGEMEAAVSLIDEAREKNELAEDREMLLDEAAIIRRLGQALEPVLGTFADEIGKTVTVSFTDRKRTILIQRIDVDQVVAEETDAANTPIEFGLATLAADELALRMESEMASPEVALAVGLRLAAEGHKAAADAAFDRLSPPLCDALKRHFQSAVLPTPGPKE